MRHPQQCAAIAVIAGLTALATTSCLFPGPLFPPGVPASPGGLDDDHHWSTSCCVGTTISPDEQAESLDFCVEDVLAGAADGIPIQIQFDTGEEVDSTFRLWHDGGPIETTRSNPDWPPGADDSACPACGDFISFGALLGIDYVVGVEAPVPLEIGTWTLAPSRIVVTIPYDEIPALVPIPAAIEEDLGGGLIDFVELTLYIYLQPSQTHGQVILDYMYQDVGVPQSEIIGSWYTL